MESIGHDMNDIIRVSIFLADIMDLNAVEKVQASFFPTYQPARTVVAVDALPQGALVFIEALVDNGEGTQSVPQAGDLVKLTNNTHAAPYDAGSTQTVAFSHYNNITMQLPLDPGTGPPHPGRRGRPDRAVLAQREGHPHFRGRALRRHREGDHLREEPGRRKRG